MKKCYPTNTVELKLNRSTNETDDLIIGVEKNKSDEKLFDFYINIQKNRVNFFKRLAKAIVFIFTGRFIENQWYIVNSTTLQNFLNNTIGCVNNVVKKEIKGKQKQRKIKISEHSKTIDEEDVKKYYDNINYRKLVEFDEKVMNQIDEYILKHFD